MGPAPCQGPARWPQEPLGAPLRTQQHSSSLEMLFTGFGAQHWGLLLCTHPCAPPKHSDAAGGGSGIGGEVAAPQLRSWPLRDQVTVASWPRSRDPASSLCGGKNEIFSQILTPAAAIAAQSPPAASRPLLCTGEARGRQLPITRRTHSCGNNRAHGAPAWKKKQNKKHARKHVRNAPRGPGWSRTSRVPSG